MSLFSIRLRQARQAAGFSLGTLAERLGRTVTKQSLSRYEKGVMKPKADVLSALSAALDISVSYFEGGNMSLDSPMLRTTAHGKLTEDDLAEAEALLAFRAERYLKSERLSGMEKRFVRPFHRLEVSCLEEAIQAADCLRKHWHCGDGPIPSIIRLMERKGIKLIDTPLPEQVMGLSTWADGEYPLVILDSRPEKTTVERLRFTAGHELGHLLLTFPTGANVEKLCNQFASFLLFPRQTFLEELGDFRHRELILEELIDLKEQYGVSVAAQVHEAWDLGLISRQQYDEWFDERIKKNITEAGWGQYNFPETLGKEKRMAAIIKKYQQL